MKKVIISADDFGLCEGTNNGIFKAMQDGIVSSTSIMACGKAFDHASMILKKYSIEQVGIHLVLDEETPLLPPEEIPSIVDSNGKFLPRGELLKKLLISKKINIDNIRDEFRAQINRCLDSGIKPSHLDGHGHVHIYPGINKIVIELAHEFNIKRVRLPLESYFYLDIKNFSLKKYLNKFIVTTFSLLSMPLFKKSGLLFSQGFMGMLFGGNLEINNLTKVLSNMPKCETIEIMSHPGAEDLHRNKQYKHWEYNWDGELNALLSMNKEQLKQQYKIEVISFNDL